MVLGPLVGYLSLSADLCPRSSQTDGEPGQQHGDDPIMLIPHRLLSADALRGVLEAFVTREGTDYGMQEVPLATKVCQVQQQLDAGTAVLVYDEDTDSCTIQPTDPHAAPA